MALGFGFYSFVRDWSVEGLRERQALFTPILAGLEDLFPAEGVEGGRDDLKVLVPGCGLGRLAYEISTLGLLSCFFFIYQ